MNDEQNTDRERSDAATCPLCDGSETVEDETPWGVMESPCPKCDVVIGCSDLLCKEDLEIGLVVKSIIQTGETACIRFTNGMSMDFIAVPTGVYKCRLMVSNLI